MDLSNGFVVVLVVSFFVLFASSLGVAHVSPFHFDEAYSIYISRMNWVDMEHALLSGGDTHPPLYNNVLKFWMFFSTSYIWLRMLSVVLALGSLIVVYQMCRENFSERVGLLSASILATSGFFVSIGRDVSIYVLYMFLSSLSVYFFLKLLRERGERVGWWYVISTALGMYTHWFFSYVLFSELVFYFFREKRDLKALARLYLPLGLLCVPLVPFLVSEKAVLDYAGTDILTIWVGKMDISLVIDLFARIVTTEISGVLLLVALLAGLVSRKKETPESISFLVTLMVLPVCLSAVVDRVTAWNLFVDRHFLFMLVPLPIIISYFAAEAKDNRRVVMIIAVAIVYNMYVIAGDTHTIIVGNLEVKKDELETYTKYDLVMHMSPFTYFPSVVYDWDNRQKHRIIYDSKVERNSLLDYILKSGVINESNIIRSCNELMGKKVALKDSDSWVTIESTKDLWSRCYQGKKEHIEGIPTLIYPVARLNKTTGKS
jgi:4-amino-4-deoxy-L-arabinose transferase-like glycosyltransferase